MSKCGSISNQISLESGLILSFHQIVFLEGASGFSLDLLMITESFRDLFLGSIKSCDHASIAFFWSTYHASIAEILLRARPLAGGAGRATHSPAHDGPSSQRQRSAKQSKPGRGRWAGRYLRQRAAQARSRPRPARRGRLHCCSSGGVSKQANSCRPAARSGGCSGCA